jgi:hypothetical protein
MLQKALGRPPAPAGWKTLGTSWRAPVAEAPLEVLPEALARFANEVSREAGCDPGLVLGQMLAVAGGVIGAATRLQIGPRWFANASIFQANVGWRGEGKGRALARVAQPVFEIDHELADSGKDRGGGLKDESSGSGQGAECPVRAVVDEGTAASWIRLLGQAGQERGLTVVSADLSRHGLRASGGDTRSDRAVLMRAWNESPIWTVRGKTKPGRPTGGRKYGCVLPPQLSITGNITPELLAEWRHPKRNDGFLDRWLFVFPDRWTRPRASDCEHVSEDIAQG